MILQVDHISKSFGTNKVLDNVTFNVDQGEIVGLLGANGAGKTTLLRIITSLLTPDSGEVLFCGNKTTPDDLQAIGYLPEERGLYRHMTAGRQAVYMSRLKGLSRVDAEKAVRYWFERLGMSEWWQRPVIRLSKGMQQKLQFVVTVAHSPKLLILDEPFSGLDEQGSQMLRTELKRLAAEGTAVILSTHNMQAADELCCKKVRL